MTSFAVMAIGGNGDPDRWGELKRSLEGRTALMKQAGERFEVLAPDEASRLANSTAAAVVFCRGQTSEQEDAAIEHCLGLGIPMFPVVTDLKRFTELAPGTLHKLNGFELGDGDATRPREAVNELAGLVLEALGLQRAKRKLFISYARADAAAMAAQIYAAFQARWYRVFLDIYSIRPAAAFQEELKQELADSDVMVLLDSKLVRSRPYVMEEIAFADQAGLGAVQVVWPGREDQRLREAGLFIPFYLDRGGRAMQDDPIRLTDRGLGELLDAVASARSDLQAYREDRIMGPIRPVAQQAGWDIVLHPGRFIELCKQAAEPVRLDVALGMPDVAALYDIRHALPEKGTARLVHDPMGVTARQLTLLRFIARGADVELLDHARADSWVPLL